MEGGHEHIHRGEGTADGLGPRGVRPRGQEQERARIARELHDTVAQDLRYCKNLSEKKNAVQNLPKIAEILENSLMEIRAISYNLVPPEIEKNNLAAIIINLSTEMSEKGEFELRIAIPDGTDCSFISEDESLNLYRIIQEAFTNILKHADAREVVVMIRNENGNEEKGLYIFVTDDGRGFNMEQNFGFETKHFGLAGMRKRSQLIGAKFEVNSRRGEGTQVSIYVPRKNIYYTNK